MNSCQSDEETVVKLNSWKDKIVSGIRDEKNSTLVIGYPLESYTSLVGKTVILVQNQKQIGC